ncbi:uncharacterized protein LOC124363630 [Homalodisca vitripennis]|uniref:uncharacterized protein LOC124363630 n=1 Tax=Homalodisca vitripennis TaxID=197043 RepID=UPI001EEA1124|nr:uncharacterized protein LOC124363630 [Homalodisca vitripennis]
MVDKREVLMISTCPQDSNSLVPSGKCNRKKEEILKPTSVLAYKKVKIGVDISDQMSSYYTPLRKPVKWFKKVALELLLDTCVVNAYVIFNADRQNRDKYTMLKFRECIIKKLLENQQTLQATTPSPFGTPKTTQHVLLTLAAGSSRKRCPPCYEKIAADDGVKKARNNEKRVKTYCKGRTNTPAMCLACFNKKH